MSKPITRVAKLEILGASAKPGAALASVGINMPQFCTAFNEATKDRKGEVVPVIITAYQDKSFDFVLKQTPAPILILKAAGLKKGSAKPNKDIIGKITEQQLTEITKIKMPDLNTDNLEIAKGIIAGSAKSLGIEIEGFDVKNIKKPTFIEQYQESKKTGNK